MSSSQPTPDFSADWPRASGGFNLSRVFVIFALMIAGGVLYAKHVEPETLQVSRAVDMLRRASAAVQQQAALARPEDDSVSDTQRLRVASNAAGSEAVGEVTGRFVRGVGDVHSADDLPRLTEAARQGALATPEMRRQLVNGDAHLRGRVQGLIVVQPGCRLTLHDVLLEGGIVSASALDGGDRRGAGAPEVVVDGSLRITPGRELPGVAVLLPQGSLRARNSSSVQIHGDVIAHEVELPGSGSLFGNLATVQPARIGERVSRVADLRPETTPWSSSLAMGFVEPAVVAFADEPVGWDDVADITSFQFPESNR